MYISRNDLAISAQSVAVGFKIIGLISTLNYSFDHHGQAQAYSHSLNTKLVGDLNVT